MERIIAAVDGSEAADRALRTALDLARRYGARLTIAHVVVPLALPSDGYGAPNFDVLDFQRRAGHQLVEHVGRGLDTSGVKVDRVVLEGPAAESLAELARAPEVGMVVVGSHGRGPVGRFFIGSVSNRLVHSCDKPVLVVR